MSDQAIQLMHGDCLALMPLIPAGSADMILTLQEMLRRKVKAVPLSPLMTRVTHCDYVFDCVGIVHFGKGTDRADMVNVMCPAYRLHFAATLTSVIVSLAGGASKRHPIRPVVMGMPAAPFGTTCTTIALVGARHAAETKTTCAAQRGRDFNLFVAYLALEYSHRFMRQGRKHPKQARLSVASVRTDSNIFRPVLAGLPGKRFPADLARECKVYLLSTCPKRIRAGAATRRLPSVLQSFRVG